MDITHPLAPLEIRIAFCPSDPRVVYVSLPAGGMLSITTGKVDKHLQGCQLDIEGVLMPYDPEPSYPALPSLPDPGFPSITIQVRVSRVYKPPSRGYGEYHWDPVHGESLGLGGVPIGSGEGAERQAMRLAKRVRGLLKPAGREPKAEYFRDAEEFIRVAVQFIQQHDARNQRPITTQALARYLMPRFRTHREQGAIRLLNNYYQRYGLDLDALKEASRRP